MSYKIHSLVLLAAFTCMATPAVASENNEQVSLQWSAVDFATDYRLEEKAPDSDSFVMAYEGSDTSVTLSDRASGLHEYRVIGCLNIPDVGIECEGVGTFSNTATVELGLPEVDEPPTVIIAEAPANPLSSSTTGAIPAEVGVTDSGSASWSTDLVVPTGIGGFTPQVSVSYSGSDNNGILGVGWSLGAYTSISRCRSYAEEDGFYSPVSFTNDDNLCFAGERLIKVSETNPATDTNIQSGAQYRLKMDPQRRVTYKADGSFALDLPSGETWYFGESDNSTITHDGQSVDYEWLLTRKVDRNGNEITYSYSQGNGLTYQISSISYSDNTISFNYVDKPDKSKVYTYGEIIDENKRLDNIVITNHNDTTVNSYHFEQALSQYSGRSLLTEIKRCNGSESGICQQATTFDYNDDIEFGLDDDSNLISIALSDYFDTEANQSPDYCQQAQNRQFPKTFCTSKSLKFGDSDGDGVLELIVLNGKGQTYEVKNFELDADSYSAGDVDLSGALFEETVPAGALSTYKFYGAGIEVVDTDGDGVDEITVNRDFPYSNSATYSWADFNGDGLVEQRFTESLAAENFVAANLHEDWEQCDAESYSSVSYRSRTVNTFDFDGDGLIDRLIEVTGFCDDQDGSSDELGQEYVFVKNTSDENGYSEVASQLTAPEVRDSTKIGDVNGDGYLDFSSLGCYTGESFEECFDENNTDLSDYAAINGDVFHGVTSLIDINGDGKDDTVYYTKDGEAYVNLAKLQPTAEGNPSTLMATTGWTDLTNDESRFSWVDLDGDGSPALVYFDKPNQIIYIQHDANTANTQPDLLVGVDNGLELESTFTYENLALSDNYTKGEDVTEVWGDGAAVLNSTGSFHVVTGFEQVSTLSSTGAKQVTEKEYEYEGYRIQGGGRGSLGFRKVTEYDRSSNLKRETSYRQDYPYIGQIISMSTAALADDQTYATILSVENEHTVDSFFDGEVLSVNLWESTESTYSLGGSDGTVSSTATAKYVKTTTNTIESDNTNSYTYVSGIEVVTVDQSTSQSNVASTTTLYEDEDITNWRITRPTSITKTVSLLDESGETVIDTVTQRSSISYDAATGNVDYQIQGLPAGEDPIDSSIYLKTQYAYDTAGNVESKTLCSSHYKDTCNADEVPSSTELQTDRFRVFRREVTGYDTDKRYKTSMGNGLFTVEQYSEYNELGLPEKVTDANDVEKYISYDDFGRVYFTAVEDGSYAQTKLGRCTSGCPNNAAFFTEVTHSSQPDTREYFGPNGKTVAKSVKSFDGRWRTTQTIHDARGHAVQISVPYYGIIPTGTTEYANFYYDNFGRKWKEEAVDGTIREMSWSGLKMSNEVTVDFTGSYSSASYTQTNSETFNGFGQLAKATDAYLKDTTYVFNALGKLVKATDMNAKEIIVSYDDFGRKESLNDPDKGFIEYEHNALGQQVKRTSPASDTQISYFDVAGRVTKVQTTSTAGNHTGEFDYSGPSIVTETSTEGLSKGYFYDTLGRLSTTTFAADDRTWATSQTYDAVGRIFQEFDASGSSRGVQYTYQNGYMKSVVETRDTELAYYTVQATDVRGNVTSWKLGNGATGTAVYNADNGYLSSLSSTNGVIGLQDSIFEYDGIGNLRARVDVMGDAANDELIEVFGYDSLNRLTGVTLNDISTLTVSYFDNGNIKTKSDVASGAEYAYGVQADVCSVTPGIHAISSIGTRYKYCYDSKGNQTHAYDNGVLARSISYTGYDKPASIVSSSATTAFSYDANFKRFKRVDTETGEAEKTTYYIGGNEVVYKGDEDGGETEFKRYIAGYVIDTIRSNGNNETYYLAKDHIGSTVTIMDESGAFNEKLSYDAFGKRRDGASWNPIQQPFANISIKSLLDITERGFTGHEHVDHANIIHMGGRIYDQELGRFAQADPIVQDPTNGQSFNRYSYVFNNPLSYTDPTGYCAEAIGGNDDGTPCHTEKNSSTETAAIEQHLMEQKRRYQDARNYGKVREINQQLKEIKKGNGGTSVSKGAFSNAGANTANDDEQEPSLGQQGASLGLDVTPVVGGVKGVAQVVAGKDLITGEELNRWHEAGYAILGFLGLKGLAKADDIVDFGEASFKALKEADNLPDSISFKGLAQNRKLQDLTHHELTKAFSDTGFTLSSHAISRLKDSRTRELGFNSLNDIAKIFNKGTPFDAGRGEIGLSYRGLEAIVDPKTRKIVTFRPEKPRR